MSVNVGTVFHLAHPSNRGGRIPASRSSAVGCSSIGMAHAGTMSTASALSVTRTMAAGITASPKQTRLRRNALLHSLPCASRYDLPESLLDELHEYGAALRSEA